MTSMDWFNKGNFRVETCWNMVILKSTEILGKSQASGIQWWVLDMEVPRKAYLEVHNAHTF